MKINTTRILGSPFIGLFSITNDELCFVPDSIEDRALKTIEKTLDVKAVKTGIYGTSLLAVFAKMNNKQAFVPIFVAPKELENIEKEIKVELVQTENALGNLVALNDYGAVISMTLARRVVKQFEKTGLKTLQTNIAKTEVVGSSLLATNNGFVMNPNSSKEEVKKVQQTLNVKGGFSTANTGDVFIRNSVIGNANGFVAGDLSTGHELNHIEEALGWENEEI